MDDWHDDGQAAHEADLLRMLQDETTEQLTIWGWEFAVEVKPQETEQ